MLTNRLADIETTITTKARRVVSLWDLIRHEEHGRFTTNRTNDGYYVFTQNRPATLRSLELQQEVMQLLYDIDELELEKLALQYRAETDPVMKRWLEYLHGSLWSKLLLDKYYKRTIPQRCLITIGENDR